MEAQLILYTLRSNAIGKNRCSKKTTPVTKTTRETKDLKVFNVCNSLKKT